MAKKDESRSKIESMTKAEINKYAESQYGLDVSTSQLKAEMVDDFFEQLEEQQPATKKGQPGAQAMQHAIIPRHKVLDDDEKEEVYEEYNVSTMEMPKIKITDPAISHMDVKEGDVIEISRNSRTAGETKFYRSVVRE